MSAFNITNKILFMFR